jgi:cobalt/nickel transport protein
VTWVRRSRFLLGFLLAALVVAGGLSSLASPDPDGLDSVTLHGCTVHATGAGEQLDGTCIAQNATESRTAAGPLAGYAVAGRDGTTGLAGVVGVLVTALLAGLLFRVLRRRPAAGSPAAPPSEQSRPGPGPGGS